MTKDLSRRVLLLGGLGATGLGGVWLLSQSGRIVSRSLPLLQMFSFEVVTVNETGKITNRQQKQARYFTEDLGGGVRLDMVEIPAGEFLMGSLAGEWERDNDEGPRHQVKVAGFFMGRFAVTQAQWQALMGKDNPSIFEGENLPVEQVAWNNAQVFCKKLSQQTGRTYRLPSEAEWEYACRAGTTTPFHYGPTITPELANYDGRSSYGSGPEGQYSPQTTPVGRFPANAFGLHDMHGNVWEWCEDMYHENYSGAPADSRAWVSGGDSNLRIFRGGSFNFQPWHCRSAERLGHFYDKRSRAFGFRVVSVVP
jgi:eukaryotic-like serine/threonine-protein kinase